MAKATRYGGPSHTVAELQDPVPPRRSYMVRRPMLGEVDRPLTADGGDSSQSSENKPKSSDKPTQDLHKPALADSHLKAQAEETGSDAHSTGGSGRSNPEKPQSGRRKPSPSPRTGSTNKASARTASVDDFPEDEFFNET